MTCPYEGIGKLREIFSSTSYKHESGERESITLEKVSAKINIKNEKSEFFLSFSFKSESQNQNSELIDASIAVPKDMDIEQIKRAIKLRHCNFNGC